MSEYNTKNYTEQGGERTVIGGELVIAPGGKLTDNSGAAEETEAVTLRIGQLHQSTAPVSRTQRVVSDARLRLNGRRRPTITIPPCRRSKSVASDAVGWLSTVQLGRTCRGYSGTPTRHSTSRPRLPRRTAATYAPVTTAAGTIYYYCVLSDAAGGATESVAPVTSSIVAVVVA
jgi:hypothetical protein